MSVTIASPPGVIRRALLGTGARFGLAIAVAFLTLTVFAPLLAPYDPYEQDLSNALSPPSALHWFGADQYGRDTLSRILYGTRTALLAMFFTINCQQSFACKAIIVIIPQYATIGKIAWMLHQHIAYIFWSEQENGGILAEINRCHISICALKPLQVAKWVQSQ